MFFGKGCYNVMLYGVRTLQSHVLLRGTIRPDFRPSSIQTEKGFPSERAMNSQQSTIMSGGVIGQTPSSRKCVLLRVSLSHRV